MELRSTHHSVRRHTPVCSHPFGQINVGCNRGRAETREEEERLHPRVLPVTTQCQASHVLGFSVALRCALRVDNPEFLY